MPEHENSRNKAAVRHMEKIVRQERDDPGRDAGGGSDPADADHGGGRGHGHCGEGVPVGKSLLGIQSVGQHGAFSHDGGAALRLRPDRRGGRNVGILRQPKLRGRNHHEAGIPGRGGRRSDQADLQRGGRARRSPDGRSVPGEHLLRLPDSAPRRGTAVRPGRGNPGNLL